MRFLVGLLLLLLGRVAAEWTAVAIDADALRLYAVPAMLLRDTPSPLMSFAVHEADDAPLLRDENLSLMLPIGGRGLASLDGALRIALPACIISLHHATSTTHTVAGDCAARGRRDGPPRYARFDSLYSLAVSPLHPAPSSPLASYAGTDEEKNGIDGDAHTASSFIEALLDRTQDHAYMVAWDRSNSRLVVGTPWEVATIPPELFRDIGVVFRDDNATDPSPSILPNFMQRIDTTELSILAMLGGDGKVHLLLLLTTVVRAHHVDDSDGRSDGAVLLHCVDCLRVKSDPSWWEERDRIRRYAILPPPGEACRGFVSGIITIQGLWFLCSDDGTIYYQTVRAALTSPSSPSVGFDGYSPVRVLIAVPILASCCYGFERLLYASRAQELWLASPLQERARIVVSPSSPSSSFSIVSPASSSAFFVPILLEEFSYLSSTSPMPCLIRCALGEILLLSTSVSPADDGGGNTVTSTSATCVVTPPGGYAQGLRFRPCQAGTFNPSTGGLHRDACLPCPPGTFSNRAGAVMCAFCAAETPFQNPQRTGCLAICPSFAPPALPAEANADIDALACPARCTAGFEWSPTQAACLPCPTNTAAAWGEACTQCLTPFFVSGEGAGKCAPRSTAAVCYPTDADTVTTASAITAPDAALVYTLVSRLPGNISAVASSRNGSLWLACPDGLLYYQPLPGEGLFSPIVSLSTPPFYPRPAAGDDNNNENVVGDNNASAHGDVFALSILIYQDRGIRGIALTHDEAYIFVAGGDGAIRRLHLQAHPYASPPGVAWIVGIRRPGAFPTQLCIAPLLPVDTMASLKGVAGRRKQWLFWIEEGSGALMRFPVEPPSPTAKAVIIVVHDDPALRLALIAADNPTARGGLLALSAQFVLYHYDPLADVFRVVRSALPPDAVAFLSSLPSRALHFNGSNNNNNASGVRWMHRYPIPSASASRYSTVFGIGHALLWLPDDDDDDSPVAVRWGNYDTPGNMDGSSQTALLNQPSAAYIAPILDDTAGAHPQVMLWFVDEGSRTLRSVFFRGCECAANFYASTAAACLPCPHHAMHSSPGSVGCTACPNNQYFSRAEQQCMPCPTILWWRDPADASMNACPLLASSLAMAPAASASSLLLWGPYTLREAQALVNSYFQFQPWYVRHGMVVYCDFPLVALLPPGQSQGDVTLSPPPLDWLLRSDFLGNFWYIGSGSAIASTITQHPVHDPANVAAQAAPGLRARCSLGANPCACFTGGGVPILLGEVGPPWNAMRERNAARPWIALFIFDDTSGAVWRLSADDGDADGPAFSSNPRQGSQSYYHYYNASAAIFTMPGCNPNALPPPRLSIGWPVVYDCHSPLRFWSYPSAQYPGGACLLCPPGKYAIQPADTVCWTGAEIEAKRQAARNASAAGNGSSTSPPIPPFDRDSGIVLLGPEICPPGFFLHLLPLMPYPLLQQWRACAPCPPGTFSDRSVAEACFPKTVVSCPRGYYLFDDGARTGEDVCTPCEACSMRLGQAPAGGGQALLLFLRSHYHSQFFDLGDDTNSSDGGDDDFWPLLVCNGTLRFQPYVCISVALDPIPGYALRYLPLYASSESAVAPSLAWRNMQFLSPDEILPPPVTFAVCRAAGPPEGAVWSVGPALDACFFRCKYGIDPDGLLAYSTLLHVFTERSYGETSARHRNLLSLLLERVDYNLFPYFPSIADAAAILLASSAETDASAFSAWASFKKFDKLILQHELLDGRWQFVIKTSPDASEHDDALHAYLLFLQEVERASNRVCIPCMPRPCPNGFVRIIPPNSGDSAASLCGPPRCLLATSSTENTPKPFSLSGVCYNNNSGSLPSASSGGRRLMASDGGVETTTPSFGGGNGDDETSFAQARVEFAVVDVPIVRDNPMGEQMPQKIGEAHVVDSSDDNITIHVRRNHGANFVSDRADNRTDNPDHTDSGGHVSGSDIASSLETSTTADDTTTTVTTASSSGGPTFVSTTQPASSSSTAVQDSSSSSSSDTVFSDADTTPAITVFNDAISTGADSTPPATFISASPTLDGDTTLTPLHTLPSISDTEQESTQPSSISSFVRTTTTTTTTTAAPSSTERPLTTSHGANTTQGVTIQTTQLHIAPATLGCVPACIDQIPPNAHPVDATCAWECDTGWFRRGPSACAPCNAAAARCPYGSRFAPFLCAPTASIDDVCLPCPLFPDLATLRPDGGGSSGDGTAEEDSTGIRLSEGCIYDCLPGNQSFPNPDPSHSPPCLHCKPVPHIVCPPGEFSTVPTDPADPEYRYFYCGTDRPCAPCPRPFNTLQDTAVLASTSDSVCRVQCRPGYHTVLKRINRVIDFAEPMPPEMRLASSDPALIACEPCAHRPQAPCVLCPPGTIAPDCTPCLDSVALNCTPGTYAPLCNGGAAPQDMRCVACPHLRMLRPAQDYRYDSADINSNDNNNGSSPARNRHHPYAFLPLQDLLRASFFTRFFVPLPLPPDTDAYFRPMIASEDGTSMIDAYGGACLTACLPGTSMFIPDYSGRCAPCSLLPPPPPNAPYRFYGAVWNASRARRWWPPGADPPHLPPRPRRMLGQTAADDELENRAGICWPCSALHDDGDDARDPCHAMHYPYIRQNNIGHSIDREDAPLPLAAPFTPQYAQERKNKANHPLVADGFIPAAFPVRGARRLLLHLSRHDAADSDQTKIRPCPAGTFQASAIRAGRRRQPMFYWCAPCQAHHYCPGTPPTDGNNNNNAVAKVCPPFHISGLRATQCHPDVRFHPPLHAGKSIHGDTKGERRHQHDPDIKRMLAALVMQFCAPGHHLAHVRMSSDVPFSFCAPCPPGTFEMGRVCYTCPSPARAGLTACPQYGHNNNNNMNRSAGNDPSGRCHETAVEQPHTFPVRCACGPGFMPSPSSGLLLRCEPCPPGLRSLHIGLSFCKKVINFFYYFGLGEVFKAPLHRPIAHMFSAETRPRKNRPIIAVSPGDSDKSNNKIEPDGPRTKRRRKGTQRERAFRLFKLFSRVLFGPIARNDGCTVQAWRALTAYPKFSPPISAFLERAQAVYLNRAACALCARQHPLAVLTRTLQPDCRQILCDFILRGGFLAQLLPQPGAPCIQFEQCRTMRALEEALRGQRVIHPTLELVTEAYQARLRTLSRLPPLDAPENDSIAKKKGEQTKRLLRGPFTYQFVRRERVSGADRMASSTVGIENGERLRRLFVTLLDPEEALSFFVRWYLLQAAAPPQEKVTLLECGTHDTTWRKWVLDIDASTKDLDEHGFTLDADTLKASVLQLAQAISEALVQCGYIASPCPFAVVSRHSSTKRSWHITLCALASFERWREALHTVLDKRHLDTLDHPHWDMARFIDPAVCRNSCSQYMQVWGSTKVKPGQPCDGNCFAEEGLWADATHPIHLPPQQHESERIALFYAATSLVMHDPWSVPFIHVTHEPGISRTDPARRVVKATFEISAPSKYSDNNNTALRRPPSQANPGRDLHPGALSWEQLPSDAAWIRDVIEGQSKRARLCYMPGMSNTQYWPQEVLLPNTEILLHAYVYNPSFCPRFLATRGILHQHGQNNKGILFCFRLHRQPRVRAMFRCFSEKCHSLGKHERVLSNRWIELFEDDLFVARRKASSHVTHDAPVVTGKEEEQQQLLSSAVVSVALPSPSLSCATTVSSASSGGCDASTAQFIHFPSFAGIPPSVKRWMSAFLPPFLSAPISNRPSVTPHNLKGLFDLARVSVLLHATTLLPDTLAADNAEGSRKMEAPTALADILLPYCPRSIGGRAPPSSWTRHETAHESTVLIVKHKDPNCHAVAYRLFVLCAHPECLHVRAPRTGLYTELAARDAACVVAR